jgi:hypothetical protein
LQRNCSGTSCLPAYLVEIESDLAGKGLLQCLNQALATSHTSD